jgi:hypothetical protein
MSAVDDILAHGIGGRQDLPIPFSYALAGAVVALIVTFVVLTRAWRSSRFHGSAAGRPLPAALAAALDSTVVRGLLRGLGLLAAARIVVALVSGPREAQDSPVPGALYVLLWVWVPLASLLVGPVWRLLSPLRTIHRGLAWLGRRPPEQGLMALPERWGYWPAAALLGVFVWLELVPPDRDAVPVVGLALAVYAVVTLLGAMLFGATWFARADPIEVYSTLAARLAPFGRRRDGRLVVRNPFDGLDGTPVRPGLSAIVLVLLGSTAYDSLSNSPQWLRLTQSASTPATVLDTLGLAGCIAVLATAYLLATRSAGRFIEDPARLPGLFAHSLLPIAMGYVIAHYYSLAVLEGQRTLILAADLPGGSGNLFGLSTTDVAQGPVAVAAAVATIQVVAVVTGHVVGAIAAHDRAVRVFPRQLAVAGQVPLLLLMIVYTYVGLSLLFAA